MRLVWIFVVVIAQSRPNSFGRVEEKVNCTFKCTIAWSRVNFVSVFNEIVSRSVSDAFGYKYKRRWKYTKLNTNRLEINYVEYCFTYPSAVKCSWDVPYKWLSITVKTIRMFTIWAICCCFFWQNFDSMYWRSRGWYRRTDE